MKNICFLLLGSFLLGPCTQALAEPSARDDIGYQVYLLKNRVDEHGNRLEIVERRMRNPAGRKPTAKPTPSSIGTAGQQAALSTTHYTVRSGDSLWGISRRFGLEIDTLQKANNLEGSAIFTGQVLRIPATGSAQASPRIADTLATSPSPATAQTTSPDHLRGTLTHTVAPGDTLFKIARRHGSSIDEIEQANNITDVDSIRVGQRLLVPVAAGTPNSRNNIDQRIAHTRKHDRKDIKRPTEFRMPNRHPVSLPPQSSSNDGVLLSYTLQKHDTLESVADIFATSTPELRRINKLGAGDLPAPGSKILVPTSGVFYDLPS